MRPRVDAYDLLLAPLSNLPGLTEAWLEEAHAVQPLQRTAGLAGCRDLRRLWLGWRLERLGDSGAVVSDV